MKWAYELENRARIVVLTIGTYYLSLLSGLILELHNCYIYFFYNNDIYYGSGIYTNSLYIFYLNMPIFNINSKKNKLDNQYP